jgi:hypothetical protein
MNVQSHLDKFRRLDAAVTRLDPERDPELWIWAAMNACTHLLNAALHRSGASTETDSFHTQIDGLYAVPDRQRGLLSDAIHAPGDVMHVGQPPLAAPLPSHIERACEALRIIENLREPYVRGDQVPPQGVERQWRDAYRTCVSLLQRALA